MNSLLIVRGIKVDLFYVVEINFKSLFVYKYGTQA